MIGDFGYVMCHLVCPLASAPRSFFYLLKDIGEKDGNNTVNLFLSQSHILQTKALLRVPSMFKFYFDVKLLNLGITVFISLYSQFHFCCGKKT